MRRWLVWLALVVLFDGTTCLTLRAAVQPAAVDAAPTPQSFGSSARFDATERAAAQSADEIACDRILDARASTSIDQLEDEKQAACGYRDPPPGLTPTPSGCVLLEVVRGGEAQLVCPTPVLSDPQKDGN